MKTYLKVLYVISWIPPFFIKYFILWPLGWFVVAFCIKKYGQQSSTWPKLFQLWGNKHEGYPNWWAKDSQTEHWFIAKFPAWWWYAMRNIATNHCYIFEDVPSNKVHVSTNWNTTLPMEGRQLSEAKQNIAWKWSWYKGFAGYRKVWLSKAQIVNPQTLQLESDKYSEFWIGWKIGSAVPGLGFTSQLRRNRKIGT